MIVNLEKISEIEKKYHENGNTIALDTLNDLIKIVIHSDTTSYPSGVLATARATLIGLGVIEIDETNKKEVVQLNS